MLFNLDFAIDNILSCSFFFYLTIDLYFWIAAFITQIFNPIADLVIPIGIPTEEATAKMEKYPVTVENNISKCLL